MVIYFYFESIDTTSCCQMVIPLVSCA